MNDDDDFDPRSASARKLTRPDTAADAGSLYQDALEVAIGLKTKHAACYSADPKGFSRVIRKANAAAFRRKPGPAPDPRARQVQLRGAPAAS